MDGSDIFTGMLVIVAAASAAIAWFAKAAAENSAAASRDSAKAALRSASAAEAHLQIETERRWHELEPSFSASFDVVDDNPMVVMKCESQFDLSHVTVEIPAGDHPLESFLLPGYEEGASKGFHRSGPLGAFDRGQTRSFRVRRRAMGGDATIVLNCFRGTESWQTTCSFHVPPTASIH